MSEETDPVQRGCGEEIERDVCQVDPPIAAKLLRHPNRKKGGHQIKDEEDRQPRVMSGFDVAQRFDKIWIKIYAFGFAGVILC